MTQFHRIVSLSFAASGRLNEALGSFFHSLPQKGLGKTRECGEKKGAGLEGLAPSALQRRGEEKRQSLSSQASLTKHLQTQTVVLIISSQLLDYTAWLPQDCRSRRHHESLSWTSLQISACWTSLPLTWSASPRPMAFSTTTTFCRVTTSPSLERYGNFDLYIHWIWLASSTMMLWWWCRSALIVSVLLPLWHHDLVCIWFLQAAKF